MTFFIPLPIFCRKRLSLRFDIGECGVVSIVASVS